MNAIKASVARDEKSRGAPPLISAVICTHNRADYLRKAIASALAQDFPPSDYEVLVVDNRSSDHTAQVCASFEAAGNVRYVHEPQLGLCHARNTGWRNARGTYIAYLDDDAIAEPGWLASIKAAFGVSPMPGMVGGKVDPIWESKRPPWLSDDVARSLTIVDWAPEPRLIPNARVEWLAGANMAIPAAILSEIGGFEPMLDRIGGNMLSGGDVFLQKRILARGYSCFYHPGMAVRHLVPRSRLEKRWFTHRYYWQGISDAVMELITDNPPPSRRFLRALGWAGRLLAHPRAIASLILPSNSPKRFQHRCYTLVEVGHIIGLLGAARR